MQKVCKTCENGFETSKDDLRFYEKISPVFNGKKYLIPPPTLCPDCRLKRRLIWRNERHLYKRKCDLCKKEIISIYPSEAKFPVYCHKCWWSDKWASSDFQKDFDFKKPFFEQFADLQKEVPRLSLFIDPSTENCDYCNYGSDNKNCYLCFTCAQCEDDYYCDYCLKVLNGLDNYRVDYSELCYECIDCQNCWNLFFSQNSSFCRESYFLINCNHCDHCIGCGNLQNKSYYIFNEKVTEDEYKTTLQKLSSQKYLEKFKKLFNDYVIKNNLNKAKQIKSSEDIVDCDFVQQSKNCYRCKDILGCQDDKYCNVVVKMSDSYDVYSGGWGSRVYEVIGIGNTKNSSSDLYFSNYLHGKYNIYYSDVVLFSDNVFGSVGIKRQNYSILNKKYSKEKWDEFVPKIIEHMQKTGEWGEFFPVTLSPFPYIDSLANDFFPSNKEKIKKDFKLQTYKTPENISDVPDSIMKEILACEDCKKNFKIIKPELEFYRKMHLPIPIFCADCRYKKRLALRFSKD